MKRTIAAIALFAAACSGAIPAPATTTEAPAPTVATTVPVTALTAAPVATTAAKSVPTYGDWILEFERQLCAELDHDDCVPVYYDDPDSAIPLLRAVWLTSWFAHEDTRARYNPAATTYRLPGSSNFNSAGVQDYASLHDGVFATVHTLIGHDAAERGYIDIVDTLLAQDATYADWRQRLDDSAWCCPGKYEISKTPIDWLEKPLP